MTISLTSEQQRFLEAQVASGAFASVEVAVQLAVAELMMSLRHGDLASARPMVDAARASIAHGEGLTVKQVRSETDQLLKSLGAR